MVFGSEERRSGVKTSHRAATRQVASDGAATAGEANSTGHISPDPSAL